MSQKLNGEILEILADLRVAGLNCCAICLFLPTHMIIRSYTQNFTSAPSSYRVTTPDSPTPACFAGHQVTPQGTSQVLSIHPRPTVFNLVDPVP